MIATLILTGCATTAPPSSDFVRFSDLHLYAESSLAGLHDHGGTEKWRLLIEHEDDLLQRRQLVFSDLAMIYGQDRIERIDAELEDYSTVSFSRGPTFAEEQNRLDHSKAVLDELVRRLERRSAH